MLSWVRPLVDPLKCRAHHQEVRGAAIEIGPGLDDMVVGWPATTQKYRPVFCSILCDGYAIVLPCLSCRASAYAVGGQHKRGSSDETLRGKDLPLRIALSHCSF